MHDAGPLRLAASNIAAAIQATAQVILQASTTRTTNAMHSLPQWLLLPLYGGCLSVLRKQFTNHATLLSCTHANLMTFGMVKYVIYFTHVTKTSQKRSSPPKPTTHWKAFSSCRLSSASRIHATLCTMSPINEEVK